MRATLDIDDEILAHARRLARQRGQSVGAVISDLARQGLQRTPRARVRNGARLFEPVNLASRPTLALVNRLRDDA